MVDSVDAPESVSAPDTVASLIDALGGPAKAGRMIGKGASTMSERKRTGVLPVEDWDLIIAAAEKAGVRGITYETLAKMHPRRSPEVEGAARP